MSPVLTKEEDWPVISALWPKGSANSPKNVFEPGVWKDEDNEFQNAVVENMTPKELNALIKSATDYGAKAVSKIDYLQEVKKCNNCGGCEHLEVCSHCGNCKNCGVKVTTFQYNPPPATPHFPPAPRNPWDNPKWIDMWNSNIKLKD